MENKRERVETEEGEEMHPNRNPTEKKPVRVETEEGEEMLPNPNPNPNEKKQESVESEEGEERQPCSGDPSPPNPNPRSVKTKVPEVEIHLFRHGKGPIDIFKTRLGGWDQDQLEVLDILDKYGFKSIFAFNPSSGRGVPIRFNPKNGRSLLPYRDGSVIFIDGESKITLGSCSSGGISMDYHFLGALFGSLEFGYPATGLPDSLVKPITKILIGVAILALLMALFLKETPEWVKTSNFLGGTFPPWVLACMVIVFVRLRKRTRDILKKYGW